MEENFPSCDQYYDVPEAIGLDGIDLEKYIIASYIIKRPRGMNVNYLSRFAAIEQSTGTWVRVPAETEEVKIEFGKLRIGKPSVIEADGVRRIILPSEARLRKLTYSAPIYLEIGLVIDGVERERREGRERKWKGSYYG